MKLNKSRLKGSGILVIILSAVVFSVYVSSNFAEVEHFGIVSKKYEETIKERYEENTEDIEGYYQDLLEERKNNM